MKTSKPRLNYTDRDHRGPSASIAPAVRQRPQGGAMALQRAAGNRALARAMLEGMRVSTPADELEREAARVASEAVRESPRPRRTLGGSHPPLRLTPPLLGGSGAPLPAAPRAVLEARFERGLGSVRIHTDGRANAAAEQVEAKAFTVGSNIYFNRGHFDPASSVGRELLAHEVTHAVQQDGGAAPVQRAPSQPIRCACGGIAGPEGECARCRARRLAAERGVGAWSGRRPPAGLALQRQPLERPSTAAQRAATPAARQHPNCVGGRWRYVYDGCSVPALAVGVLRGQQGSFDKDNPAGGRDTQFAIGQPTTRGGRACDRHDECYQTCASDQAACDARMFRDMMDTCAQSQENQSVKARCYEWAHLYYKALRAFGEDAFKERKEQVCACDKEALAPALTYPPLELLRRRDGSYMSWVDYLLKASTPPLSAYRAFMSAEEFDAYIRGGGRTKPRSKLGMRNPAKGRVP